VMVKTGDRIPIDVSWRLNGAPATGAVARAVVLDDTGERTYWNGDAFTTTPADLAGLSFIAGEGRLVGSFLVPPAAEGKILSLEVEPTGPPEIVGLVEAEEYRAVGKLAQDVSGELAMHEAARGSMETTLTSGISSVAGDIAAARAALESNIASVREDVAAARAALEESLAELDADIGETTDPADDDGSLHAKVKAVAGRQKMGRIEGAEEFHG